VHLTFPNSLVSEQVLYVILLTFLGDEKWVHEGIEVKVKTRDNRQGYIQHVDAASLCEVKLFDSGEIVMALPEQLNIVRPEKKQKVRVLYGDYAGHYGTLVGLEGSDGVIKLQNGGTEVINMSQLAKSM
jgi:transcription elongation factor SPT5